MRVARGHVNPAFMIKLFRFTSSLIDCLRLYQTQYFGQLNEILKFLVSYRQTQAPHLSLEFGVTFRLHSMKVSFSRDSSPSQVQLSHIL